MALKHVDSHPAKTTAPNDGWWRGGVIYQIYPRSYQDSNGDGIGDLPGITQRLEHIAHLGADAIWLSPFFRSPMKDFGYDISDYCDVDPMFGTLDDFRTLVARAHALGLKVMIDQVYSHTSDQHPWFVESRASRANPKADWYVWADPLHDGNPPNNWLSVFGGSSWQWDTRRRQYYLHNFLTSQPDLNFHNPDVQEAVLASVKFWLDIGVDGYRLDVVNMYFHDQRLRSNPGRGEPDGSDGAVPATNPYGWQWHQFDKSQPENLAFLQRLRALVDAYPNTTMVGEIGDDDGLARVAEYTRDGDKLHMAYCFDLLGEAHDAPFLHRVLTRFNEVVGSGWPCWAITNHDIARVATRWGGAHPPAALLRAAAALQLSLRGSSCIYQGDELGLPEAEIAFEDLQDPYGIAMWPEFKGRDGCRTPMPWDSTDPRLGFGSARPWLPAAESHRALAVDRQEADGTSLLHFYRQLLAWRRGQPALIHGDMHLLPVHDQVLAYVREHAGERVLCAFNFSGTPASYVLPAGTGTPTPLDGSGVSGASADAAGLHFAPWGVVFARLT
ncbi:alpha-glucosidase [Plasticicumulans lactativorans]|uniref:Alpha-glucosidase n=1 Tax=Plasticicumulans lactativorans TaxID=1133106 RepID=A0A4R2L4Y2_9GAMM|nr:alpha-glucosidase family protein [Plasticicumulans lactativorans]TCO82361.1 alpha-glucosidase [Plasticicumulans lactativorans]